MASELEIRPLRREDDRGSFSCGQEDLDRYFKNHAGQNQFKHRLSGTWVAVDGGVIQGFITVSLGELRLEQVPPERLRRRLPAYPLPVFRVARLGVDQRAQGKGVGAALLRWALLEALEVRARYGCVGVVTDAKPDAVPFYDRYGFFRLRAESEGGTTAMMLLLQEVEQSMS